MLKKSLCLALASSLLSSAIFAAPVPEPASGSGSGETKEQHDKQAASELAEKLQSIKTLSASFQQMSEGQRGRVQLEAGEMQVKRPNQFRWEIQAPYHQQIISRNDKVWVVDPDLLQVVIKKQDDSMGATPAQLLSGDAQRFLADYRVVRQIEKDEQVYTLRPVAQNELFEQLNITFQKGVLTIISLKDSLGGQRQIQFTDVKINESVSDSLFRLDIPKDFDVIDETRT